MGKIIKRTIDIPLNALENMDEMFFRQIQMNGAKVMKKFAKQYEDTKVLIFSNVNVKGIFTSIKIQKIDGEDIYLENNEVISSKMLSNIFENSEELIICAITLWGYDELEEAADGNLTALFLDGWGTVAVECGHVWLKDYIKKSMEDEGLYLTNPWSPGQHNVDIKIQKNVFDLLHPEEIGIELSKSFMMHPKKSITSFIGIGNDSSLEQIRACDFCERRETCPSAYI